MFRGNIKLSNSELCSHGLSIDEDCQKCNALLEQLKDCKYCGDLIPYHLMTEHQSWCIPMIEKGESGHWVQWEIVGIKDLELE